MSENGAMIHARGLVKRFGDLVAVDGIDLDVKRGEAFGFLGPNGAGKSSTMRMIGCVSPVTAGTLRILGQDPGTNGPEIRARLGVVPQQDTLDFELTVRENVLIYGRYFGLSRRELKPRIDELLDFVQLTERAERQGRAAVGRDEAAPDDRALARQRPRPAAARRADDGPRPAGPPRRLGPPLPPQAAGQDASS